MSAPSTLELRIRHACTELVWLSGGIALGAAFRVTGACADSLFAALMGWTLILGLSLYIGIRVAALATHLWGRPASRLRGGLRWGAVALLAVSVGASTALLADDVRSALVQAQRCS